MKTIRYGLATVALAASVIAAPVIGTLSAKGVARVDDGQVRGSATLFDGSVVETSVPTRMELSGGTVLGMDANSRGRVYTDHAVMERGSGALAGSAYRVAALGMNVVPESGGRVLFSVRDGQLEVAPLEGSVLVTDASGATLARVAAGESLAFDAPGDQGAQGPEKKEEKKKRRAGAAAGGAGKAGGFAGWTAGQKAALWLLILGGGTGLGVGVYEAAKSN